MNIDLYISKKNVNVVDAMTRIDSGGYGIIYIIDDEGRLIGSVSDGDIRRWIIKTNDLTAKAYQFMNPNPQYVYKGEEDRIEMLKKIFPINSVPILDRERKILEIVFFNNNLVYRSEENEKHKLNAPVIIMAGGKGTRLYPYTKILPKPLIPIGDTPILERIINKFVEYDIRKFYLTVNYKKNMIKTYFSELAPDYDICYVEEEKPLGTGGGIKLIDEKFDCPIFVANCDQLINANYKDLYDYHINSANVITVVSALKNIMIPYGVLKTKESGEIIKIEEKPKLSYFINTGMYVINPEVISLIPNDTLFHMTHLIDAVKDSGGKVGMYPISEDSFLDMGEFVEMQRMEEKLNVLSDK